MATIRAYTTIEQSRKLADILPLESADMTYYACVRDWRGNPVKPRWRKPANALRKEMALPCANHQVYEYVPAWSLAALLSVLPIVDLCTPTLKMKLNHKYYMELCIDCANYKYISTNDYDNPVDACVAMIEKLHELKML